MSSGIVWDALCGMWRHYVVLQTMEASTASHKQDAAADALRNRQPALDAREALMSAIRSRQFNLNRVCRAPEPRKSSSATWHELLGVLRAEHFPICGTVLDASLQL